jgi:hypothetical protein
MDARRTRIIGDHIVAEFYWNGHLVVYVDNKKCDIDTTFLEACRGVEATVGTEHELVMD